LILYFVIIIALVTVAVVYYLHFLFIMLSLLTEIHGYNACDLRHGLSLAYHRAEQLTVVIRSAGAVSTSPIVHM